MSPMNEAKAIQRSRNGDPHPFRYAHGYFDPWAGDFYVANDRNSTAWRAHKLMWARTMRVMGRRDLARKAIRALQEARQ